jgi:hypothetical protein
MPKPDPPYDYDRRRAEDVFRALENDIFPRLGAIDTKVEFLEQGVQKLMIDGCAQRAGDIHRTQAVEANVTRIFEKIDGFGAVLSEARVDMAKQVGGIREDVQKQIGGIRIWVLGGCVAFLIGLLAFIGDKIFK